MKTCKDCEKCEIIDTGLMGNYIILCNKYKDYQIYLGYEFSVKDIDETYEICEYYEEESK